MKDKSIYYGFANLFKGVEAVGGTLYLTKDSLVHKAHALNVQNEDFVIPLETISEVKTRNTAGIIPNGLLVITNDGVEHKFVVYKRKKWVNEINKLLEASL